MKYRPEIDGLRALAVIPVILFHGGFAGFDGGFVGVDVFFVISGYLITTILAEDLAQGRFSLLTFYERRARRILPALFLVVAACIPFAWIWFVPRDFLDFAQSVVSVMTFWSNILFWRESGYFSTAAELKPLLHTWSLAVEEQFYVFFPVLLWAIWRLGQRAVLTVLCLLFLASLALAEWGAAHEPTAAFYLLPTRGWELLIGSLAALAVKADLVRNPRPVAEVLGIAGLALIGYAIVAFDKTTAFPGLPALVPTVGALFLILPTHTPTLAHRLLSLPVLVGIGLISYSAYLWHQPLFAFARYRSLGEPPETLMLGLVLLSFGLAWLTWKVVETPFRSRDRVSRTSIFIGSPIVGAGLCALGAAGWVYQGFPSRLQLPPGITASMQRSDRSDECFNIRNLHTVPNWTCKVGVTSQDASFFVFGDSHAFSLLPAIEVAAERVGKAGEFTAIPGCTPLIGVHALRPRQGTRNCNLTNNRVLEHAISEGIELVIMIARWSYYTDGGYGGDDWSYISREAGGTENAATSRAAFEQGLEDTIAAYKDAEIDLVFIAQVPEQLAEPIRIYGRAHLSDDPERAIQKMFVPIDMHRELQSFSNSAFKSLNANLIDLTEYLCDGETCPVGNSEISYYVDGDHLSIKGSLKLVDPLASILEMYDRP